MFEKIQHIGYLVSDLDVAIGWFAKTFGGLNAGGSNLPDGPVVPSAVSYTHLTLPTILLV